MRDTEPPPSWRGGDGYDESAVTAQIEEPLSHYALKNFCLWFRSKAQIVFSNWAVDLDYEFKVVKYFVVSNQVGLA